MTAHSFEPRTWQANTFLGRAESGRTRPLRLLCTRQRDDEGPALETAEFFAKFNGLPEIYEKRLFAEMVGNALARASGILTGEPAFIELDAAFSSALHMVEISLNPGLGVGSRNLGSGVGPPTFGRMSDEQLADAARLYLFDLLVQNPDRRLDNPNCLVVDRRIAAIDFESCFSFLYPILGQTKQPWQVSQLGISEHHVFRKALQGASVDWGDLTGSMLAAAHQLLTDCARWIPEAWDEWAGELREHFVALDAQRQELGFEVVRSLS